MGSQRRCLMDFAKAMVYKERRPMTSGNVMSITPVESTIAISLMHGTKIEGLRRAIRRAIAIWIISPAETSPNVPCLFVRVRHSRWLATIGFALAGRIRDTMGEPSTSTGAA